MPPASAIDEFNVGYFHGRPQVKSWIISEDDLKAMYANAGDKDILLWCDGQGQATSSSGRKRKQHDTETEIAPKCAASNASGEEKLEEYISELQEIHGDKYDYGEYRLWARMIKNHQWKDKDSPPNLPMIRGKASRKGKHDVVDTLANAAVAIMKALRPSSPELSSKFPATSCKTDGMSPGKKVQLRSQYLKQLKEIQNLRDKNVLSADEFQVEKETILKSLRELK